MPSDSDSYFHNKYKTYKEATSKVVTWLIENARRCNVDVESHMNLSYDSLVTGPNGQEVRSSGQHALPLKSFETLATAIVSSRKPKIKVPQDFITLTRTVIALRTQFSEFCDKVQSDPNDGHRYFVKVLEKILSILEESTKSGAGSDKANLDTISSVTNRFEALIVEETTFSSNKSNSKRTDGSSKRPAMPVEVKPDSANMEEIAFAIFAFFSDVNEVLSFVSTLWGQYTHGKISLSTAGLTSDTAFLILERMCNDLNDTILKDWSYTKMVSWLEFYVEQNGKIEGENADLAFRRLVCRDGAAYIGNGLAFINLCVADKDFTIKNADKVLKSKLEAMKVPEATVASDSYDASARPGLADLNVRIFAQLLLNSIEEKVMPLRDHFTAAMIQALRANEAPFSTKQMPMFCMFAMQILFDADAHIQQDMTWCPYEELEASAVEVIMNIKAALESPVNNANRFVDANRENFGILATFAGLYTTPFEKGETFLVRLNPVMAGISTFGLRSRAREASMSLCNTPGNLLFLLHLYNAARKSGGLDSTWDDLEFVMAAQTTKYLFFGAPPVNIVDYYKRCQLSFGAMATNFAPNRRLDNFDSNKRGRPLKARSLTQGLFHDHYSGVKAPAVNFKYEIVAEMLDVSRKSAPHEVVDAMVALSKKVSSAHQYTPVELLVAVATGMHSEATELVFDYAGLHERATTFLLEFKDQVHDKMAAAMLVPPRDALELPQMGGDIFKLLQDNTMKQFGIEALRQAAGMMKKFIDDGQGDVSLFKARNPAFENLHRLMLEEQAADPNYKGDDDENDIE